MAKVWKAGMRDRFALEGMTACYESGGMRRDRLALRALDRVTGQIRQFGAKCALNSYTFPDGHVSTNMPARINPAQLIEIYEVKQCRDGGWAWHVMLRSSAERESILRLWRSKECQEQARAACEAWGI